MTDFYEKIGAHPVINAAGNSTSYGGSTPSPAVQAAMDAASKRFVEMDELLEKSGAHIASLLGVEAAYVTPGCYAAMVLSTAACITGNDPEKIERIPDTTGMKNEIILQAKQRYGFDRAYTLPGSTLVLAGDANGCTPEQLESAIGPSTAAVAYLVNPTTDSSLVSLEDAVKIAHAHGVPVIADAASQIYPLDYFRKTAQAADLVCFGGKYVHAPHSVGFVCGKKELIDAVVQHGFIADRPFGRGMKVDRQEIIGMVAGVDEWFSMNHEERFAEYRAKLLSIELELEDVEAIRETKVANTDRYWGIELHVVLEEKTAGQVTNALYAGNPRIRADGHGNDTVVIRVDNLEEGDEHIIAARLREVLS
jgi:D-glucosaminate-6-phosphate ammonia-lyase